MDRNGLSIVHFQLFHCSIFSLREKMVGRIGFEPMKAVGRQIYSLLPLTTRAPAHDLRLGKNGAGDRNRTGDLPLTRRLLYQLSYASPTKHPFFLKGRWIIGGPSSKRQARLSGFYHLNPPVLGGSGGSFKSSSTLSEGLTSIV